MDIARLTVPSSTGRFISIQTVAAELGVSTQTVRRMIADELLPAVRFGVLLRVPRGALEEYLEENAVTKRMKEGKTAGYEADR
jgi:excisionase family DNA binding protein